MFDAQAIKEGFGRAAVVYDEYALLQRHVREYCLALAKPYWKPGAHILDIGSGTGALARQARQWNVLGLDVSFGMCCIAHTHAHQTINADAHAMPFARHIFDGIFSSLMLQWASNPAAVFSEMTHAIKPHGHAVLSTLVTGTLVELQTAFAVMDAHTHVSDFHETHQLLGYAKDSGFSLVMARQTPVVEYYPDAIALMRSLQTIGATHKQTRRRKGLMTPQQFARMEHAYEKQRVTQGLPATWQVLYLVLQKT